MLCTLVTLSLDTSTSSHWLSNYIICGLVVQTPEAVVKSCSVKKACNFIKKETLAQVLSCEFCKISKNNFFYRTPLVAASETFLLSVKMWSIIISRKTPSKLFTVTWVFSQEFRRRDLRHRFFLFRLILFQLFNTGILRYLPYFTCHYTRTGRYSKIIQCNIFYHNEHY